MSNDVDVESELLKLDGLLEKVSKEAEEVPMPEDDLDVAPGAGRRTGKRTGS